MEPVPSTSRGHRADAEDTETGEARLDSETGEVKVNFPSYTLQKREQFITVTTNAETGEPEWFSRHVTGNFEKRRPFQVPQSLVQHDILLAKACGDIAYYQDVVKPGQQDLQELISPANLGPREIVKSVTLFQEELLGPAMVNLSSTKPVSPVKAHHCRLKCYLSPYFLILPTILFSPALMITLSVFLETVIHCKMHRNKVVPKCPKVFSSDKLPFLHTLLQFMLSGLCSHCQEQGECNRFLRIMSKLHDARRLKAANRNLCTVGNQVITG